jgi:hypothetical protein
VERRREIERRDHGLRVCHRRDELGTDEADRLDEWDPGGGESTAELGTGRRRHRHGLRLEPVPGPDVADDDRSGHVRASVVLGGSSRREVP